MVMTKEQTANIVSRLYAAGNNKPPEEFQLVTWHDSIKHLDWPVAVAAAKRAIVSEERTPSISVFLEYVEEEYGMTGPSYEDAITEVLEKILMVGSYQTPTWSNERIERAVKTIGWINICQSEGDYWKTDFRRAYANLSKQESVENKMALSSGRTSDVIGLLSQQFSIED